MTNSGLLFVLCAPPADFEDELNDWYDREHIPERLAIPGFLGAARYVSEARPRRYLALYDLERHAVLSSPEYAAFSGANNTPWTQRAMARAKFTRLTAVQRFPGDAQTGRASRLLVLRFCDTPPALAASIETTVAASFGERPGILQWRVFECQAEFRGDWLVVVEGHGDLGAGLSPSPFGELARHLALIETFRPY